MAMYRVSVEGPAGGANIMSVIREGNRVKGGSGKVVRVTTGSMGGGRVDRGCVMIEGVRGMPRVELEVKVRGGGGVERCIVVEVAGGSSGGITRGVC